MLDAATTAGLASTTPYDHHGCYGNSPRSGWIVAITHPQAERHASSNLQHRGYVTYLPLIATRVRDRHTPSMQHLVQRPLWPGYLFVHYDSRDPRRPIRETPGVRDLIRCGSEVQWAPDAQIHALQATEAFRATQPPETAQWAPGAAVAVANGPFQGHPAVVLEIHPKSVTIAVMLFGHLRQISVGADCLVGREAET